MKKTIVLALLAMTFLNSCNLFKHTAKETIQTKDSTWTVEKFIPHSYTVTIPGEKVLIHDTIPCPELEYHKEVTKNHLTAKVNISKGVISVECLADSLQKVIDGMDKEISTYRQQQTVRTIIEEPKCDHIPTKWDIICYIFTAAGVAGGLVWLYLKFKP